MSTLKDPLDDFYYLDYEQTKWLESRPKCDSCGEHIQDEWYHKLPFAGMEFKICDSCLKSYEVFV